MAITNPEMKDYPFLREMYEDSYFPDYLVDKGKQILIRLCERIEAEDPIGDEAVYKLTHAATEEFNDLAEAFAENDSEIETVARDAIGTDFNFIAKAYGYDLDPEEIIAPRDW